MEHRNSRAGACQIADIRRFGAAAVDLCWVACGRVDGYWEVGLNAWDHAAGALIAVDGTQIPTPIGSICVHGDTADAVAVARALRQGLLDAGYRFVSLPELAGA